MSGYTSHWRRLCERVRSTLIDPECWLCGEAIDLDLDAKDPWSLTFDHVVPRIHGGEDSTANMATAHRACNTRRSNRIRRSEKQIESIPIKQSRVW